MTIPWAWIGGTLTTAAILFGSLFWWWTRRRNRRVPRDVASDVVGIIRANAEEKSDADYALAVAAGGRAVAEADAAAEEEEIANAGNLVDHMRDLDSGAE